MLYKQKFYFFLYLSFFENDNDYFLRLLRLFIEAERGQDDAAEKVHNISMYMYDFCGGVTSADLASWGTDPQSLKEIIKRRIKDKPKKFDI